MMKNNKFIVVGVVLLLLIAGAGYKLYLQREAGKVFTGTIEVTKADVTPMVSGYLADIKAKEGQQVTAGEIIAEIDDKDYVLQMQRDTAALLQAEAVLKDLEKGARNEELEKAVAGIDSAQSTAQKAHKDLLRYNDLYSKGAISRQQYDEAESAYTVARKQLEAVNAEYKLLLDGTREDQIAAQREAVKSSKAVMLLSKNNLEYTKLSSPVNGVVLTKNYEAGEFVNAGAAVITVADLSDCWVKIYVPSEMLGKISFGQKVGVKVDSYPEKTFSGVIKEISDSAEYTPRQSISPNERANMVFAVKVQLENNDRVFKAGMIADVMLDE